MNVNFDSREYLKDTSRKLMVGVFGSRTLDYDQVEMVILEKIQEWGATHIATCQEPRGVSEVAQRVAKEYGYPLELHFLNYQYLRGAFEQRAAEIVADCDCFIIIHDGKSKGTTNEKRQVEKAGKPYHYEVLPPSDIDRAVGFNIKDDWGMDNDWSLDH